MNVTRKRAVVIGAGIGGISMGIRLQAMGWDTTIVDKLDSPGGRACVLRRDGFVFDMGPTVITVPHFIEELFALRRDAPNLDRSTDFPEGVLDPSRRVTSGISGGPETSKYCDIVPVLPFYRILFEDGTWFDYDADVENTRAQIAAISPEDVEGYERFQRDARAIFERGFVELGYTYFGDLWSMLRVAPDLLRLDAVRSLFSFTGKYFRHPKLQQVFSFETLLVGGNPLRVPAIYAMIHLVERTWGIHYVRGGTGALIAGMVRKFEELGGRMMLGSEVARIDVEGTPRRGVARGVTLIDGRRLLSDIVVSNGDYAHTYAKMVDKKYRRFNPDIRIRNMKYSMSLVVVYFGFRSNGDEARTLRHHNIILGPRYEGLLTDIFDNLVVPDDFSQYLHIPTLTNPSLAPEGHHAAYVLVPVAHNGSGVDWAQQGDAFVERVLRYLDERGHLPGLMDRIVTKAFITPDHFERRLSSHLGNAFGVEPRLTQTAWFRPHNRSEDVAGLYLVGANTQPGAGTPSVMMSAKITARAVFEDHGTGLIALAAGEPERVDAVAAGA